MVEEYLSERDAIESVFLKGKKKKEKMYKSVAEEIVKGSIDAMYEEMKKGGLPIEVGYGDIKTEKDLAKLHQELEASTWKSIKKYYKIIED